MKKVLSFLLAASMLLSMIIVVSVPTAAIDGDWTTYTKPSDYGENDDGSPKEPVVAGYEYTEDGFTTVDADWTGRSPYVTVQTKNPVNIQDGVYLKVCVDRYAYEGNDAWINLNIWDSQNIQPGAVGYGQGVQTIIRPDRESEESEDWYYSQVQWWGREWQLLGSTPFKDAKGNDTTVPVVDGKVTFELELKYDGGTYTLNINGAEAPSSVTGLITRLFPDGEAYIGITLHNSTYDSTAGLTILEFGTCKEDAVAPAGDDYRAPQNAEIEEIAEIADPSTVPAGQPAILMTGNKEASDTKSIGVGQGDTYTIDDDYTVRVADANGDRWNSTSFKVKDDVSYDIDDFPVMMFLTRNFCTCDDPMDCYAVENCQTYIMAGDGRAPASGGCQKTPYIDICWDPVVIEEGENAGSYLYFWYDTSSEMALDYVGGEGSMSDWTGRIHGVQMEFSHLSTDPARNEIPIVWVAFFRTVEEGEEYVYGFLDGREPEVDDPIADPSTVPEGEPCFVLTGDTYNSATKDFYNNFYSGSVYAGIKDTISMTVYSSWTSFTVEVDDEAAYDIDDFPVMLLLTKDFCTCNDFDDCYAIESISGYLMTGDQYDWGDNQFPEMAICWEPIIVDEGEMEGQYLYFMYDFADDLLFTAEGRINSIRFDISGLKYQEVGRNSIDVVFVAFFRTCEEAEEYVYSYLDVGDEDDTTDESETTETTEGGNNDDVTEDVFLDNYENNQWQIGDLVKDSASGNYYTVDGNPMYIAVNYGISWLGGYALKDYVDAYTTQFFDMSYWSYLVYSMDENGLVPLNDISYAWLLMTTTGNPAWQESEMDAYVYFIEQVVEKDVEDETTEEPTVETTEDPTVETTEDPTAEATEETSEEVTKKKKNKKDDDDDDEYGLGCGSVIGASAAAVVALVALGGAVVLKKKED